MLDHGFPQGGTGHDESHVEELDYVGQPFVVGVDGLVRVDVCEVGLDGQNGFDDAGVCVEAPPACGDFAEWE